MTKDFVALMKERGMMAQVTHEDELVAHLAEKPRTAYVGFDPTAASLHIGHILPVLALRRWQQCGHRVIALMGGGTAMVGDPTGKTEMRSMVTKEIIDERSGYFRKQLSRFLDFSSPEKGLIVDNGDWLRDLNYIDFLREYGSQFSVNRMLGAECFKSRLEKGLSFLEFNYMILQSYDFYHLAKEFACTVQLGGDDQWSNMLGGMDLIRRKSQTPAFCFTVPLLVSAQGNKMGKTEKGAVWVDAEMTSPFEVFQYFRNIEDADVEKCLLYFTDLAVTEIKKLTAAVGKEINEAKVILAHEVTKLLHGQQEADAAKDMAAGLFQQQNLDADAPVFEVPRQALGQDIGLLELLHLVKIAPSRSEARRWVQQGGLMLDGEKITDPNYRLTAESLAGKNGRILKKGKRHYYRLRISDS